MKRILIAFFFVTASLTGCYQQEGTGQKMGREIDDTIRDAGKKEKTTTEKVGESIRDLGDKIEDEN